MLTSAVYNIHNTTITLFYTAPCHVKLHYHYMGGHNYVRVKIVSFTFYQT